MLRIGRRRFILAGGASLALVACGGAKSSSSTGSALPSSSTTLAAPVASTPGFNALWIPPALEGPDFALDLAPSTAKLLDGADVAPISYNGAPMWGPTLIMRKGDDVSIAVTNHLAEDTTTHWHGIHLPPEMDGGPHQVIAPGATWNPSWTVKNNAATYWYHPHAHELTWKQMNQGAGGFLIIRDDEEAALDLPRTYGVDDIPLVLTSRAFTDTGEIETTRIYGDHALANGVMDAEVGLPAQRVRFRILNAEIERAYTLGFSDGRSFSVIATDSAYLAAEEDIGQAPCTNTR